METLTPQNFSPSVVVSLISFGTWFSLVLTGQSAQEAYTYFSRYPKDRYDLKAIIGILCVVNVLHAVSMIQVNYSLVIRYGLSRVGMVTDLMQLRSFFILKATACLTLLISHFFFARRAYKLGLRAWPFMFFVGIMLLAGIVFTAYFTIYVFVKGTGADMSATINIICTLSISFLLDVVITARIVSYLLKRRTGFRSTDNFLKRLVRFSVNTGLLTGILTLLPIILMAGPMSVDLVWYPAMVMLAPVHTSVVLAAVNSRQLLVDRGSGDVELRSFDLDVSPDPEPSSTIRWADAERSCPTSGSDQGEAQTTMN